MSKLLTAIIFTLTIYYSEITGLAVPKKKLWNYEITDIKFVTSDKNLIDGELHTTRISRGVYGVSGFIDFKIDLDENTLINATFMRDPFCANDYKLLPYSYFKLPATKFLNTQYKSLVMDAAKECTSNSPVFETFEPPLTKRNVTLMECQLSNDNLPSHAEDGCYRGKFLIYGPAEAYVLVDVVIEREIY